MSGQDEKDISLQLEVEAQAGKRSSLEEDRGGLSETGTGCCRRMLHPSGRGREVQ